MEWELTTRETVSLIFLSIGTFFIFTAGLGLIRMPDLFLRMSMTTKGATFGVGSVILGSIIFFDNTSVTGRGIAIIIFMLLTVPISAHMIGRAGYLDKYVDIWDGTKVNELKGRYNLKTHSLDGMSIELRKKFEQYSDTDKQ
jgi:multicomponent Na+:H+ antiporter subunit G